MEIQAYAKLNLSLDILSRRSDGYHEMCMVMQTISLCDTLSLEYNDESGIRVSTNLRFLPNDERNLAAIAAKKYWEARQCEGKGLSINIDKKIPVCAGMGGGSADAAAVLRALNKWADVPLPEDELAQIGEQVGSDVPYCVIGGTALAEGKGERLSRLAPLPDCFIVVCKPAFSVSTPELFGCIDCRKIRCRPDTDGIVAALSAGDLPGVARRMYNVFEDVLPERKRVEIAEIKSELISFGALGAVMSGTGPTVFGIFDEENAARDAFAALKDRYCDTFFAKPV